MIPEGIEGHAYLGLEVVYFLREDIVIDCLQKLQQAAELTLDASDPNVQKNCADNMILIGFSTKLQIQKHLQYLRENSTIEGSLRSRALNNWQEILHVVKGKKFALITHRNLSVGILRST